MNPPRGYSRPLFDQDTHGIMSDVHGHQPQMLRHGPGSFNYSEKKHATKINDDKRF